MQKEKRRKWTFWKLKVKKRLPSITEPPENGTRREVNKEESVSDVGEVSQASCSGQLDSLENLEGSTSLEPPDLVSQYQMFLNKEEEVLAATRIQTAFRGYLVRLCTLFPYVISNRRSAVCVLTTFPNFNAGKESSTCVEGNSETPSIYQRWCSETPSSDYIKTLAICCQHSVTGLRR